ncbi:MAG: protein translocase subunit SecF [Calditrichia bacterium]
MRILKKTNIDFLSKRKIAYVFSALLILASLISLILHGGPRYSIDFQGGTFIHVKFLDNQDSTKALDIDVSKVRTSLTEIGLSGSEIKHYGSLQDIGIRVAEKDQYEGMINDVITTLEKSFPGTHVIEMAKETVSAKVGTELVWMAIKAILFASFFILVYVMFRFEFRFSLGAVLALFHDVIITLGVFSVFNVEISLPVIAAFLTIVGYSLNDTIVVYDRIRENMKSLKKNVNMKIMQESMNRSINETLSRTLVTSLTTLLVVIILLFFGGEVLFSFAFALTVGIMIGTYSSVFVASPVVLELQKRLAMPAKSKNKGKSK